MSSADGLSEPISLENVGRVKDRGFKEDNDGVPAAREEQLSVQRVTRASAPGTTQKQKEKQWKEAVMQRLKDHKKTDEISYLNGKNWLGDQTDSKGNLLDPTGQGQPLDGNDAFADLWQNGTPQWRAAHPGASPTAVYQGYTWGHGDHPTDATLSGVMQGHGADGKQIMGDKKGTKFEPTLMHDAAMQTITSVQRKQADGTTKSTDPATDNYVVGAQTGDLVKVTYPDGSVHYMPTDDTNPGASFYNSKAQGDLGEISKHAKYGYPDGTKNVTMQAVGRLSHPDGGDHFTNDEWDEIGSNNYRNKDGTYPNTREELDAARAKAGKKPAKAPPKTASTGGGPLLLYGHPTVMHGADARYVGYAHNASEHAAGGYMQEGSSTVFVGEESFPVSRVGDGTSDGMVAVTGAEDFFIGGTPMKA